MISPMEVLPAQMRVYYEKKYPGITFSIADTGRVTAHYMQQSCTLQTLTSIDPRMDEAFGKLRPVTYHTVEYQVTGDELSDLIHGCRELLNASPELEYRQVAVAALQAIYGRPE